MYNIYQHQLNLLAPSQLTQKYTNSRKFSTLPGVHLNKSNFPSEKPFVHFITLSFTLHLNKSNFPSENPFVHFTRAFGPRMVQRCQVNERISVQGTYSFNEIIYIYTHLPGICIYEYLVFVFTNILVNRLFTNTVEPPYREHHWDSKKVSAVARCPL